MFIRSTKTNSRALAALLLSSLLLGSFLLASGADAIQIYKKRGYVQARGQILGENDQPILVEVDEQGEELQEIGELFGPLEGVFTMSAFTYQTLVDNYTQFIGINQSGIARGAIPLSSIQEGA